MIESDAVSSGPPPNAASSTTTVTSSAALVSKSRAAPACRCNSGPPAPATIWNNASSAPIKVRLLLPSASSVTTISATFTDDVVSVFSARLVVAPESATVGASFTSVTVIESDAVSSGPPTTVVSSTATVTSSAPLVSKSRAAPAFKRSSVPTISNSEASVPDSDRALLPSASSVTSISATFIAREVFASSARLVVTPESATVGASLTAAMSKSTVPTTVAVPSETS